MPSTAKPALPSPPSPEARNELLRARRNAKMARSAQTYLRGSTKRFYAWLDEASGRLPHGPSVWICGDCHYANLGPIADGADNVAVQIRDLDQTVIGNPAHDIVRLALSLAGAARGFDLPGSATALMIEQITDAYRKALTRGRRAGDDTPPTIDGLIRQSRKRSWRHLAYERIDDPSPEIPLGKRFLPLAKAERLALEEVVASEGVRALITGLKSRPEDADVQLLDAAYWVKGCSSLGLLRYALLVGVGKASDREFCLVDIKEAVTAAAPRTPDADMPRGNAERVVAGAKALSPHLGERMSASTVLGAPVFIRELRPQDLKLELASLDIEEAVCVARFLAGVVGRAHAGQMNRQDRLRWAAELGRNQSKSLEAPSWLWSSVVDLLALHEAAYLDHCRRFAKIAA